MRPFQLQIYTQERKVVDEQVISITVPGAAGYLGVWAHHAPLVANLRKGVLTIRKDIDETTHRIEGGFIEVRDNVATLLVDSFEAL